MPCLPLRLERCPASIWTGSKQFRLYTDCSSMPTDTATGLDSFVERIRSGDVRALARAITAIENDSAQSLQLMKALFPHSGNATVIGLTGSPGAGKSTLVDQLARDRKSTRLNSSHANISY